MRLHGKGDKWRQCPLWLETAKLLKALIVQDGAAGDSSAPVFSHGGEALTRFGIYKVVRRHAAWLEGSARDVPRVTPHVFRHSAATSLLESGAGLNVIRAWLGHASLESTHRYAEVTYRMKAEMVERCAPPEFVPGRPSNYLGWRKSADLLGWLESL